MKSLTKIKSTAIYTLIILISACEPSVEPETPIDEKEVVIEQLSKTWSPASVSFENSSVATDWSGFSLIFDKNKTYSATALSNESVLVWPSQGTYTFPDPNNPQLILRDDGVEIKLEALSETSARLKFRIDGRNEGGRIDGLVGEWVFEMSN